MTDGAAKAVAARGLTVRPARPEDVAACAAIWRISINDYTSRLGQPEIPMELGPITRLYTHLQISDGDRFLVAERPGEHPEIVAFTAATVRDRLWYLSMLFVLPEFQGSGLGRELLERILPSDADIVRGVATDSAQPISNALYARYGMVPRMPLLSLTGLPQRPEAFGDLPSGVVPLAFEEIAGGSTDGQGHRLLTEAVDQLDAELAGASHPVDHRFLRTESRRGWLYRGPDGSPIGYGYAGEAGRVGPVAVRDSALLGPVLGHLTSAVQPRGAFAMWVPGFAGEAVVTALAAGFRLDPFPVLLCWDRPFADFSRYLPISPGLV
ncbi:MAG: GNAT family N-acetyltransferase [Chloroflexota bacterium]